jgi:predicted outer membrane protein
VPAFAVLLAVPTNARGQSHELSDAQIAHAVRTAASISIEVAALAESHAMRDEIEAFAATLGSDYEETVAGVDALAIRLNLGAIEEDPIGESLEQESDEEVAKFDDLGGLSFDRSYLARVIAHHRAVLDALDRDLIPQVQNAELDALLANVRSSFAAHLQEAEELATSRS